MTKCFLIVLDNPLLERFGESVRRLHARILSRGKWLKRQQALNGATRSLLVHRRAFAQALPTWSAGG
jgi:hypothetical protein